MRLRYAAIALLSVGIVACGPRALTAQQAADVARSHMHGDAEIVSVVEGPLGELATDSMEVTDPNRRVWAIRLRGTFLTDCTVPALGELECPPEPRMGLMLLDYLDGSFIASSVISFLGPGQTLPN